MTSKMTATLAEPEREAMGIYFAALRFSVGVEDADDFIENLRQAPEE